MLSLSGYISLNGTNLLIQFKADPKSTHLGSHSGMLMPGDSDPWKRRVEIWAVTVKMGTHTPLSCMSSFILIAVGMQEMHFFFPR